MSRVCCIAGLPVLPSCPTCDRTFTWSECQPLVGLASTVEIAERLSVAFVSRLAKSVPCVGPVDPKSQDGRKCRVLPRLTRDNRGVLKKKASESSSLILTCTKAACASNVCAGCANRMPADGSGCGCPELLLMQTHFATVRANPCHCLDGAVPILVVLLYPASVTFENKLDHKCTLPSHGSL
jgi:hypothetical protein